MMKRLFGLAVGALGILATATGAQAIGLGGYVEAAGGSNGSFEYDTGDSFDVDERAVSGGFVMDTALRNESLFNYRLQVGAIGMELEDEFGTTLELGGVVFDNTFGFAMVLAPAFRLWAGPQVRIGYVSGDSDADVRGEKVSVDLATVGVGVVLGANFSVSPGLCLSWAAGVRYEGFAGEGDAQSWKEDLTGEMAVGFVNMSLLFETGGYR
jgi:hypothetical protein